MMSQEPWQRPKQGACEGKPSGRLHGVGLCGRRDGIPIGRWESTFKRRQLAEHRPVDEQRAHLGGSLSEGSWKGVAGDEVGRVECQVLMGLATMHGCLTVFLNRTWKALSCHRDSWGYT